MAMHMYVYKGRRASRDAAMIATSGLGASFALSRVRRLQGLVTNPADDSKAVDHTLRSPSSRFQRSKKNLVTTIEPKLQSLAKMVDLEKLARTLGTQGPARILPTPRLVQLQHNGTIFLKTTKAVYVWEPFPPYEPQIYIPASEFHNLSSTQVSQTTGSEIKAEDGSHVATYWKLTVNRSRPIDKIIAFAPHLANEKASVLQNLVKIDFQAIDLWLEETRPVAAHPLDPFKRIDILASTRHIVVKVGGIKVADTYYAQHLYETGLPRRHYLPRTAVDPSILMPSTTRSFCPYKGEAKYYSVEVSGKVYKDLVWYYDSPLPESAKVEGLLCFYDEKVDVQLDGEELEQPTHQGMLQPVPDFS